MAANGWCPSGRFFEAAACGTPLITDWWEGLETFFEPEREVRVVANAEDVEDALKLPKGELASMAAQARRRTLEEHTGEVRARQLLDYLEEARSSSRAQMAGRAEMEREVAQ